MFYTIYKITNKINNKVYIGKHKTNDLNDGYMGSGKLIRRAIEKHGVNNFSKEILFIFNNEEDMNRKEKELVVVSEETYNLCEGGHGGFSYINRTKANLYGSNGNLGHGGENLIHDKTYWLRKDKDFYIKLSRSGFIARKKNNPKGTFFNRKHSEFSKQKIKLSLAGKQSAEKNSQFGTCWITNGQESKKIKKEELDNWLKLGYSKGRI